MNFEKYNIDDVLYKVLNGDTHILAKAIYKDGTEKEKIFETKTMMVCPDIFISHIEQWLEGLHNAKESK